jgi:transcriptional regulator with XRE-family HTH domain
VTWLRICERGEKIISIEALIRIARAVKTPIRDFFNGVLNFVSIKQIPSTIVRYFTIVKCVVNIFLLYSLWVKRKAQAICVKALVLLKEERERRKLSKYFVAQESGLSPQMIGYVESGDRNPTLETVLRMAEAIGVNFEDVIKQARKEIGKSGK